MVQYYTERGRGVSHTALQAQLARWLHARVLLLLGFLATLEQNKSPRCRGLVLFILPFCYPKVDASRKRDVPFSAHPARSCAHILRSHIQVNNA